MRLDKLICHITDLSRKEVKEKLRKGLVKVDGVVQKKPDEKVDVSSSILFDNEEIFYKEYHYYMLNKPAGVITATEDSREKTVMSLLDDKFSGYFPVGRLDKDTEGLLLITNDGPFAHFLLSPRFHVAKTYYVELLKEVSGEDIIQFKNGIDIGEKKCMKPAEFERLTDCSGNLTIYEGKYHQIKRMFEKTGNKVTYLKRLKMGNLALDASLKPGAYRELSIEEEKGLKKDWQKRTSMQ